MEVVFPYWAAPVLREGFRTQADSRLPSLEEVQRLVVRVDGQSVPRSELRFERVERDEDQQLIIRFTILRRLKGQAARVEVQLPNGLFSLLGRERDGRARLSLVDTAEVMLRDALAQRALSSQPISPGAIARLVPLLEKWLLRGGNSFGARYELTVALDRLSGALAAGVVDVATLNYRMGGAGSSLILTGTGFRAGVSATVGGLPAASLTVNSPTQLTLVVPAGLVVGNTVDVAVTQGGGTDTLVGALIVGEASGTVSSIAVGGQPIAIHVDGDDSVWVVNSGSDSVTKIAASGHVSGPFAVGHNPAAVEIDGDGAVWVANFGVIGPQEGGFTKLDADGNVLISQLGDHCLDVALDGNGGPQS